MSGTAQPIRVPDLGTLGSVSDASRFVADKNGTGVHAAQAVRQYMVAAVEAEQDALAARIAALESGATGWRRVGRATTAQAQTEVRLPLPDGYSRYRVEFQGVNPQSGAGTLMMRVSSDGTSFNAGQVYSGVFIDTDGGTVRTFNFASAGEALFSGTTPSTADGTVGALEYNASRGVCLFHMHYVDQAGPKRYSRQGVLQHPPAKVLQFFLSGFQVPMASGGVFDLMARP